MIDANTPLEKIAEMCNTTEDLRNLLKQCDRYIWTQCSYN